MAKAVSHAPSTIHRIWQAFGLPLWQRIWRARLHLAHLIVSAGKEGRTRYSLAGSDARGSCATVFRSSSRNRLKLLRCACWAIAA